jgi:hypothetical protein
VNRLLPLFLAVAIVFGGYRVSATRCRRHPAQRPWIVLGAIGTLALAGLLVPWLLADLDPPLSESPAGIFVYLGKAIIVGVPGLGAFGALIGAVAPAADQ